METIITSLIAVVMHGGPEVSAVLLLFIILLLLERKRLLAEVAKKESRIDKIVDDYHAGNISITEAMNSLKMVLYELRGSIK